MEGKRFLYSGFSRRSSSLKREVNENHLRKRSRGKEKNARDSQNLKREGTQRGIRIYTDGNSEKTQQPESGWFHFSSSKWTIDNNPIGLVPQDSTKCPDAIVILFSIKSLLYHTFLPSFYYVFLNQPMLSNRIITDPMSEGPILIHHYRHHQHYIP